MPADRETRGGTMSKKQIVEPKRESEPTELKLDDMKKVMGGSAPLEKKQKRERAAK
jgi:hypothetical protein